MVVASDTFSGTYYLRTIPEDWSLSHNRFEDLTSQMLHFTQNTYNSTDLKHMSFPNPSTVRNLRFLRWFLRRMLSYGM